MTLHVSPSPLSFTARLRQVRSRGGISAWLVEDHTLPIVSMAFAFRGGAALDPMDRAGAAYMMGGLFTEGAGSLNGEAFGEALADEAIRLSFYVSRDRLGGNMTMLAPRAGRAFSLLGLALRKPRFDAESITRKRDAYAAEVRMGRSRPAEAASIAFWQHACGSHPYARPVEGDLASLAAIRREDIIAVHCAMIRTGNLCVSVVGAIGPEALGSLLDEAFAALPEGRSPLVAPTRIDHLGEEIVTRMDVPQSTVVFGRPGIPARDPDFPAALVAVQCLGGGFTSRLFKELRTKRGLCYSVSINLEASEGLCSLVGMTSTRNDRLFEALDLIGTEIDCLMVKGIGEDELAQARSYMIGFSQLGFDTSGDIAGILLSEQFEGHEPGWLDERNRRIATVTRADASRAIERVFGDGRLLAAISGDPTPR